MYRNLSSRSLHSLKTFFLPLASMMLLNTNRMMGQNSYHSVPENIDPNHTYLFYLHGAIVQQQGANAVSEQFGPYEYNSIVEAFAKLGYQVISEVRPKNAEIPEYAVKVVSEIDRLLENGVPPGKIVLVGASMGGYIAIEAAYELGNSNLKFAVLGVCSDYAFNYFSNREQDLCGNFFSIYENSDQPGSCNQLLNSATCQGAFKELALSMGNGHGFLYKPYPDWIGPLSQWINIK